MASTPLSSLSSISSHRFSTPSLHPNSTTTTSSPSSWTRSRPRCRRPLRVSANNGGDLLGDFGARDPFPAEVASNFGDKVLGNPDTEHRRLIPNISALSLAQKACEPVSASQAPMPREDAEKLLKKVVGWRLVDCSGGTRLQCLWKLRDYGCGVELINRINRVVEAAGHFPDLHLEQPNQVRAELWTASIGGLCMNDFVVAAKIDEIKTMDLLPKKRIWA